MPSYAQIADDVAVAMGMSHDDALRYREAILYNVKLVIDKVKKEQLSKQYGAGDARAASSMLSTFQVPVVYNDVGDAVVTDFDAVYFDLPTSIYSLPHDGGINFVRYLRNDIPMNCTPAVARTPFTGTTLASLNNIYASAYQRPAPDRPYFARAQANSGGTIKERVYLFGLPSGISALLVGLYAAVNYDTLDPDAPVDIPEERLHTVKKLLLADEAWLLQIPQERLRNEGRDFEPGQTVQTRSPISLNDPSQADA